MSYSDQHYGAGNPDCPTCQGIGYVRHDVPLGHPHYGRAFDCECRIDHSEEGLRRRVMACGVGDDGWEVDGPDGFMALPGREDLEQAIKDMAKRITEGECNGLLTLISPYAGGKTALGEWLIIQAIRAGHTALFLTALRYSMAISNSINPDEDGDAGDLSRMLRVDVLVFDQPGWIYDKLGSESFAANRLRLLLDERYRNRQSQATILLENMAAWEKRHESNLAAIWSRASEGKIVVSQVGGIRYVKGQVIGDQWLKK